MGRTKCLQLLALANPKSDQLSPYHKLTGTMGFLSTRPHGRLTSLDNSPKIPTLFGGALY